METDKKERIALVAFIVLIFTIGIFYGLKAYIRNKSINHCFRYTIGKVIKNIRDYEAATWSQKIELRFKNEIYEISGGKGEWTPEGTLFILKISCANPQFNEVVAKVKVPANTNVPYSGWEEIPSWLESSR